jgi:hypothetical protein
MLYKSSNTPSDPTDPITYVEYDDPQYIVIHREVLMLVTSSKSIAYSYKRKIESAISIDSSIDITY